MHIDWSDVVLIHFIVFYIVVNNDVNNHIPKAIAFVERKGICPPSIAERFESFVQALKFSKVPVLKQPRPPLPPPPPPHPPSFFADNMYLLSALALCVMLLTIVTICYSYGFFRFDFGTWSDSSLFYNCLTNGINVYGEYGLDPNKLVGDAGSAIYATSSSFIGYSLSNISTGPLTYTTSPKSSTSSTTATIDFNYGQGLLESLKTFFASFWKSNSFDDDDCSHLQANTKRSKNKRGKKKATKKKENKKRRKSRGKT